MDKFKNNKLLLIIGLVPTILLISGGTFAYFQWQSSLEDKTNVIVSVTDDIEMRIDPAAIVKTGMRPTNNCGGSFAMSGNSLVTIDNNTGVLARPRFKLKLKITDRDGNNITNETSPMGNPYRQYIKYVVTETDGDCTSPLSSGRFNLNTETSTGSGWYESSTLTLNDADGFPALSDGANTGVSFDAFANRVTTHTYKVWVWIDETYTAISTGNTVTVDKLQDATVTVSWSDNSTVEQVHGDGVAPSMPELTGEAYAVYSADDTSLRFYRSETPIEVNSEYNDLTVTEVYTGFEEESYAEYYVPWDKHADTLTTVVFEDEIVPVSTAYWFSEFVNLSSMDVTKLNTSNVTDMTMMFSGAGINSNLIITGLENFDVSNVIDMGGMLAGLGYNATNFSLDLSSWDVSNVTNMKEMFYAAGVDSTNFSINLTGWDTSNVTDMSYMFAETGYNTSNLSLNLSDWDVSNVTNMSSIFSRICYNGNEFTLTLNDWNFSDKTNTLSMLLGFTPDYYDGVKTKIKDLHINLKNWDLINTDNPIIFYDLGRYVENIYLDLSGWKISAITDIRAFGDAGFGGLGSWTADVSNWDLTNVTDMGSMFSGAGLNAKTFNIIGLNTWDVSNITDMSYMFYEAGKNATTFNITGGIENWNVSNVTDMSRMFENFNINATNNWSLDLSNWNICNVVNNDYFAISRVGFEVNNIDNIIQPNWNMECPA